MIATWVTTPRSHQLRMSGPSPTLIDVAAEQEHDAAAAAGGGGDALDDRAEISRRQHVGQSSQECRERAIAAGGEARSEESTLLRRPATGMVVRRLRSASR